jgi:hypothetical protein
LFSHIKGRTYTEGVTEQGAEEDVWFLEGGSKRKLKKIV